MFLGSLGTPRRHSDMCTGLVETGEGVGGLLAFIQLMWVSHPQPAAQLTVTTMAQNFSPVFGTAHKRREGGKSTKMSCLGRC